MNKTKTIREIANNLKGITANLEALIESLRETEMVQKEKKVTTNEETSTPKAEPITIEKVRAVLAAKSQGGKQREVKALIVKYGANKLTELNPSCYEELLKEAEAL